MSPDALCSTLPSARLIQRTTRDSRAFRGDFGLNSRLYRRFVAGSSPNIRDSVAAPRENILGREYIVSIRQSFDAPLVRSHMPY